MSNSTTWVGIDVHKENIVTVSISGDPGTVMTRWETPNTAKGKERLAGRIAGLGKARCVYEAGPCGYDLRRFLETKGIPCDVIAPSLIPKNPGDRVKTDKKDAEKIARMHRMGELTAICVPSPAQEALRDLLRAREDANEDLVRCRHRLQIFLLRQGRRFEGKSWPRWPWHRNWRGLSGRSVGSESFPGEQGSSGFCGGCGDVGNGRRTLGSVMRQGVRPQPALLDRGSSGRIIVMRSNPRISA